MVHVVAHSAAEVALNLSEAWHFCWKHPFVLPTAVRPVNRAYLEGGQVLFRMLRMLWLALRLFF